MFTRLQYTLKTAKRRRINLTTPVHKELSVWCHLVASLATRPTHLREIRPHLPTWIRATYDSLTSMGGICYSPSRDWHVWRLTFRTAIRANILTDENPKGFLTINDLEMAPYIAHLHLFSPHMKPLEHIITGVDSTAAESWDRRGSVSTATAIGPLPREAAWITRQANIHASIMRIPGVENIEADAASQLTHVLVHAFLKSFNTSFPQPTPWRLSLLPYGVIPRLHIMCRNIISLVSRLNRIDPSTNISRQIQNGDTEPNLKYSLKKYFQIVQSNALTLFRLFDCN